MADIKRYDDVEFTVKSEAEEWAYGPSDVYAIRAKYVGGSIVMGGLDEDDLLELRKVLTERLISAGRLPDSARVT